MTAASNPAAELTEAEVSEIVDAVIAWADGTELEGHIFAAIERILAARLAAGGATADEGLIRAAQASALREAELEIRDAKTLDVTTKAVVCARLRSRARALTAAPAPTEDATCVCGKPMALHVDSRTESPPPGAVLSHPGRVAPTEGRGWTIGGRPVDVVDGRLVEPGQTLCVHHVGLTPGLWCGGCQDALATVGRADDTAAVVERVRALADEYEREASSLEGASNGSELLAAVIKERRAFAIRLRAALAGAPSAPAEDQGGEE